MATRILIVDDSPIARMLMRDLLESRGHQVAAEAENLAEAVRAYQEHKPDLVTLDLSLGQDDGISVLQELLKLDGKARVLIVSGNPQKQIQKRLQELGARGFLPKPFSINELEAAVQRIAANEPL